MPGGIPVGTLAIGNSGAKNAALLAVQILSNHNAELRQAIIQYRAQQAESALHAELKDS